MQATQQQRAELINITLNTLKDYIGFVQYTNNGTEDVNSTLMHLEDIAYITNALRQFAVEGDLDTLNEAIYLQDTFVREYYIKTINAIEEIFEENYCEDE
jgi:hypothetical protein